MQPTWFEHVDLMQVLIGTLFLVVAWFIVKTLKEIDNSQKELFSRLQRLERDFYVIQGEHNQQSRIRYHS